MIIFFVWMMYALAQTDYINAIKKIEEEKEKIKKKQKSTQQE